MKNLATIKRESKKERERNQTKNTASIKREREGVRKRERDQTKNKQKHSSY